MSKLVVGMKVEVDHGSTELRNGTIKALYEDMSLAIVSFDDGTTEKVPFSRIVFVGDVEKPQDETPTEPTEKTEITLTPEEFKRITTEVLVRESLEGGPIVTLAGAILCAKIHKALFCNEVEE